MADSKSRVKNGDVAPDFVLRDQNGKEFKLSDFRGKRVLLSFHPAAWTRVCSLQMQSLEANKDIFESLNTVAVGVSVDTIPSKRAWAKELGITSTRLLADFWPHGHVAKLYGIFREQDGISERANIILDEAGKVIFFKIYEISQLPDIQEVISFLRQP
ncbi:MAG: redoxin domain-containing protein [Dehalococcoidia bacterium]